MSEYWEISPNQFKKYMEDYGEREKRRAIEMDTNNYNLGKYVAIAVNNPKKYPREPFLKELVDREESAEKVMTVEEMQRVARAITYKLGGKVDGNKTRKTRS